MKGRAGTEGGREREGGGREEGEQGGKEGERKGGGREGRGRAGREGGREGAVTHSSSRSWHPLQVGSKKHKSLSLHCVRRGGQRSLP